MIDPSIILVILALLVALIYFVRRMINNHRDYVETVRIKQKPRLRTREKQTWDQLQAASSTKHKNIRHDHTRSYFDHVSKTDVDAYEWPHGR